MSQSINNSDEFKKHLQENMKDIIKPGESKVFYQSYGFINQHDKFAFGHIKYSVKITNEGAGRYHVEGQVRDVYNFEKADTYLNGISEFSLGSYINNQAFILQKGGVLYPFIYAVQIDLYIEDK